MELYLPLILDGATGTELQKKGYTGAVCAEQWTLKHPEVISEIQKGYADAGSNIVYSPTFGANRVKLEEHGLFNKVTELNAQLALISRNAVGEKALVAGDMAPTGKLLAPLGDVSFEELVEIYTEQASALEPYVDLFVVETQMTVPEARAAVLAVKSVSKKPVLCSFSCDAQGKTMTGTDVTAALVILQSMGVDAFGLNCSQGPKEMLHQIRRLTEYAEVPLIAKPNAGIPQLIHGKTVYNCDPRDYTDCIPDFADAGVALFGGCCGSTAEHIAAISSAVKNVKIKRPAPVHTAEIVLATEQIPVVLPADVKPGPAIACDGHLEEVLETLEEDAPLLTLNLSNAAAIDALADSQNLIRKPVCFVCSDAAVLEGALRVYQGRALYDGPLTEEELKPLARKYGLVY